MANPTSPVKNNEESRTSNFGQFGSAMKTKAQETAASVGDKAKDLASNVADTARETASSMAQTAGDVAANVGHKAADATSAVGGGMKSLAGTIRDKAPHGGIVGSASAGVADTLESGGRYLEEHGLKGIGDDLTNLIRRNPFPALLVGIGFGYLLARATRR